MCGPSQQYNTQVCVCVCEDEPSLPAHDADIFKIILVVAQIPTDMKLWLFAGVKLVAVYLRLNDGAVKDYVAQKCIRPLWFPSVLQTWHEKYIWAVMEAVKGQQSTEEDLRAWVKDRSWNVCVDCDGEKRGLIWFSQVWFLPRRSTVAASLL